MRRALQLTGLFVIGKDIEQTVETGTREERTSYVTDYDSFEGRFGAMVEAAVKQLGELHGIPNVPAPYTALYHDWSDDPYGGGWHEWKAGYRFIDVIPKMLKPILDERIYICGEAYSTDQGWVEGSLATAETMLQKHLKLERPDWIDNKWALGD